MNLVITLRSEQLQNPDLDIRYELPKVLSELSGGTFSDNGYDYTEEQALEVFLKCGEEITDPVSLAKELLSGREILGNDIVAVGKFRLVADENTLP